MQQQEGAEQQSGDQTEPDDILALHKLVLRLDEAIAHHVTGK